MNAFEKIMLGLLASASTIAPIFIHSSQGFLILNASETVLANILAQLAQKSAVVPVAAVTE